LKTLVLSKDLLQHYRTLSEQSFTVVDLETTGQSSFNDRAIEISILQANLKDGILHQETHFLNPEVLIPPYIQRFTGISQDTIETAPLSSTVWQHCLPLLSANLLTAHHIAFDYSFIQAEYAKLGVNFARPAQEQLCTVILSRLMLPDLPSRSLPFLVNYFEFPVDRSHRAEPDTLACWLLAEKLLKEIQTEADEVLLARFARQRMSLEDAAKLLGCSAKVALNQLTKAGAKPKISRRSGTAMYQRGDIETLLREGPAQQLSLL
jgi:DNA polymerase III subunit epsilon